uniref:Uncharacterized protein n=1 Tax=Ciona savignyi TaxID=51511 RepID=H2YXU1_CIOSA
AARCRGGWGDRADPAPSRAGSYTRTGARASPSSRIASTPVGSASRGTSPNVTGVGCILPGNHPPLSSAPRIGGLLACWGRSSGDPREYPASCDHGPLGYSPRD